jgi:thymidylate synthase
MLNIPVITLSEKTLAMAFEKALVELYKRGTRFKTQYDKPGDPESLDCTLNLTIEEPESEPMIHMAFPAGIEQLKEYVLELKGYKDHWVKNSNDPSDTRWEYTYHGRLEKYGSWQEKGENGSETKGHFCINQIEGVISKLCKQPFTRQAQMITWMPDLDLDCFDPPCLQSLWYRMLEDENGIYWLNCNIRFRSNDAWGASFMNMFGFIQFNKEVIASEVSRRTGKEVKLGRLNWQADSYHIYGKDIAQARDMLFDRIESMEIEERTFNFSDDFIRKMYDDAEPGIIEKIRIHDMSHTNP